MILNTKEFVNIVMIKDNNIHKKMNKKYIKNDKVI